jgi:predicted outer membrane protein
MNLRNLTLATTIAAAVVANANLQTQAQQPGQVPQPRQPGQVQQAGQAGQWQTNDQKIATCVAIANQEEIAIAKIAKDKTNNKDVKEFAEMLMKDHNSFLQKLQKYAPEATREGYLDGDRDDRAANTRKTNEAGQAVQQVAATDADQRQPGQPGQPGQVGQPGQHLDFVAIHREIAEECIRNAKQEFGKKDGSEVDECFIGAQIVKHHEMKSKLAVLERHVSGELKQVLADGRKTTESHLKKAESIMKDLMSSDSKSDSKRKS